MGRAHTSLRTLRIALALTRRLRTSSGAAPDSCAAATEPSERMVPEVPMTRS